MSLLTTTLGIVLLLATVITIIYLIGRIDLLESFIRNSLNAGSSGAPTVAASTDKSFLGLEGKALWDALSGAGSNTVSEEDLNSIRGRYATLLKKHITTLFAKGLNDGKTGESKRKSDNPMAITTLRGTLSAWLPQQHVSSLYSIGYESARADDIALARLLATLTETIDVLYVRTGLSMEPDFPQSLLNTAAAPQPTLPAPPETPGPPESSNPPAP